MNIKTLFWAGTLFLSAQAYSQIGITTPTPSSTLDVRGSVEGSYREITGNYTLADTDYHVSFSGVSNATLSIPAASATDGSAADFRGRKYYIKNNSTATDLTLMAASGQILRLGGASPDAGAFVLKAGKSAVLTAGNANGWDLDVDAANWQLINSPYFLRPPIHEIPAGNLYTDLEGSQVTVTVPSSNTKVILNYSGYIFVQIGTGAVGTMRFQIVRTGTSPATTYPDVDLVTWNTSKVGGGTCDADYSIMYPVSNLAPGTYTFTLQMRRESESFVTASSVKHFSNETHVPRVDVYSK
ncbi:hypothetical protein JET18_07145 [Chryseobacterium sp. L7]|uniref:DUF4397 domain-containing protein n=1 Tax=Chryseobacterium endalhagicum TaxID=2797638 RepID=A0ABS1QDC0_9FLAO|nr:hypothetical protein [Chryseobacterium endalhagicum]MBL1220608.1 hypothetical protein [Chryseobacterium endalhagicum]